MQSTNQQEQPSPIACTHCSHRTPFRPDPEAIQRAKQLQFEPPLDEGIRDIVLTLVANGIETFESCEGGQDTASPNLQSALRVHRRRA